MSARHGCCCDACRESLALADTRVLRPVADEPTAPASSRFEIVRCLGSGGMGVVYEAIDRLRGRRVALKRLRYAVPELICRFRSEFRALQATRHASCVRAFELIEGEDDWLITMELVDGVDFLTWVKSDLRRLRSALAELVRALMAVHEAGLVHRDVKPANILVTRAGRLVLVDFGLATSVRGSFGERVGTPAYVAPEQAASASPAPASDWYSVGVVLYHALTGALPFDGTATETLARKSAEDPLRPRARVDGVPEDLEELCVDLLSRDPSARPGGRQILARLVECPAVRLAA